MLSTITIISIFTEIFASGILAAGAAAFFKNYFSHGRSKDFFSGILFFAFFLYVAATVASQIMFNLGRGLSELILVHKGIGVSLMFCSTVLLFFIFERFNLAKLRWSYIPFSLMAAFFIYRIIDSSVNLIYRQGIIEPIVDFSSAVPIKPFFALVAFLLAVFSFASVWQERGGKKTLAKYLGYAALFLLLALLCGFLYVRFGESGYLLASWLLILAAALDFLLAELIPADSAEAKKPLRFLRTRLLFKLLLIFVLLIVILFEATTLATISISKNALSKAIINNYLRLADSFAAEIEAFPSSPSFDVLQGLVSSAKIGGQGVVFVVDKRGEIVSHPDRKRALEKEDISGNEGVKMVLAGKKGGGEFQDKLGTSMVGGYAPVAKFGWGVVVQEPLDSAYSELRMLETNSLLFVIAGIVLTSLVGIFFANSIERPIKELTRGTEAVAGGDLNWQIGVDSVDEIGKLAKAFNQMTKELRESQDRLILSEKLASLGTMAAGMAHEIKNPLVSLRTFTQLLQQKWEDREFRDKFSSIIPHEIERINRIAESLLKFGKPMKPEMTAVDVNALLDEVLMLFESECKKYNIRVTKKLAEVPKITADAGQLQQAFVNVVKNAIEAMQKQGGEFIIKTDVGEVVKLGRVRWEGKRRGEEMVWGEEEELDRPMPAVFIEFTDTGEGIAEENLKSLFDPFFTTKMTGTGMGLPITLRIIEEHGGSLKVRSQLGRGTTFIITLPLEQKS